MMFHFALQRSSAEERLKSQDPPELQRTISNYVKELLIQLTNRILERIEKTLLQVQSLFEDQFLFVI